MQCLHLPFDAIHCPKHLHHFNSIELWLQPASKIRNLLDLPCCLNLQFYDVFHLNKQTLVILMIRLTLTSCLIRHNDISFLFGLLFLMHSRSVLSIIYSTFINWYHFLSRRCWSISGLGCLSFILRSLL